MPSRGQVYGGSIQYSFAGSDIQMDPRTRVVICEGTTSEGDGSLVLPTASRAGARFFIHGGDINILDGENIVGNTTNGVLAHRKEDGWVLRTPGSVNSTVVSNQVATRSLAVSLSGPIQAFNLIQYLLDNNFPIDEPVNIHVKWDITVTVEANGVLYADQYATSPTSKRFAFTTGAAGTYLKDGDVIEIFSQEPEITLVNKGLILGAGGKGFGGPHITPEMGQGTHAIEALLPLTIDNQGMIAAGGGGGTTPVAEVDAVAGSGQGYVAGAAHVGSSYSHDTVGASRGTFTFWGFANAKNQPIGQAEIPAAQGGAWGCPGQAAGSGVVAADAGKPGLLVDGAENVTWAAKGAIQGLTRDTTNNTWHFYYGLHQEWIGKAIYNVPHPTGGPIVLDDILAHYGYDSGAEAEVKVIVINSAKVGAFGILRDFLSGGYGGQDLRLRVDTSSHPAVIDTGTGHHANTTIEIEVEEGCLVYGHGASANQSGTHPDGGDAIDAQHTTVVTNHGTIAGGGGAGASIDEVGQTYVGGAGAGYPNGTPSVATGTNINGEVLPEEVGASLGGSAIAGEGGELGQPGNDPVGYEGAGTVGDPSEEGYAVKGGATINNFGTILGKT